MPVNSAPDPRLATIQRQFRCDRVNLINPRPGMCMQFLRLGFFLLFLRILTHAQVLLEPLQAGVSTSRAFPGVSIHHVVPGPTGTYWLAGTTTTADLPVTAGAVQTNYRPG